MTFFIKAVIGCILLTLLTTQNSAFADSKDKQDRDSEIQEKVILGWLEHVWLKPWNIKTKAKLDTGAKTSSLHAKNIEYFEKDGERWVRFQFGSSTKLKPAKYQPGKSDKVVTVEAPLYRTVMIKQHKRSSVERPVIMLSFLMGGEEYKAQFTLTDRSKFLYPVLLGRRFLKDVAIVDPAGTYLRTSEEEHVRIDDPAHNGHPTAENEDEIGQPSADGKSSGQNDKAEHKNT